MVKGRMKRRFGALKELRRNESDIVEDNSDNSGVMGLAQNAELHDITRNLQAMVDTEDGMDNQNDFKISLKNLFDSAMAEKWIPYQQIIATGNLEDEMELYELLDLDADGVLDDSFDPALEDVLCN